MAKETFTILNTDEINRQNVRIPARELVSGLEKSIRQAIDFDLPLGVPSHIGHDMHRPTGWCLASAILLTSDMARQIGTILEFEPTEKDGLIQVLEKFWEAHDKAGTAGFEEELRERAPNANLASSRYLRCEAACLQRVGLASELFPQLFDRDAPNVDKDGLVDLAALREATEEVQPGVFREKNLDVLLFAHPYYRRSLSRRNALNGYFLSAFSSFADRAKQSRCRIRLDPDLIGHPRSVVYILEFEYWHGPKFGSDIESIPSGVNEHKADDELRHYEGVDKTQMWWKTEETRDATRYRTFEDEELVENPSEGISSDHFGCRYVHSEYDVASHTISHFDGAIRAYNGDAYLDRIDLSIDRAGKHADYTKLFRIDGPIDLQDWKSLMANYFRGNTLISEYFSETAESKFEEEENNISQPIPPEAYKLMVCIVFDRIREDMDEKVLLEITSTNYGYFHTAQWSSSALRDMLCKLIDPNVTFIKYDDGNINFPAIRFGEADIASRTTTIFGELANALEKDIGSAELENVSFNFEWPIDGMKTKLAIAGNAKGVLALLRSLSHIVQTDRPAAEWTEALHAKVKECASHLAVEKEPVIEIKSDGRLLLVHARECHLLLPK